MPITAPGGGGPAPCRCRRQSWRSRRAAIRGAGGGSRARAALPVPPPPGPLTARPAPRTASNRRVLRGTRGVTPLRRCPRQGRPARAAAGARPGLRAAAAGERGGRAVSAGSGPAAGRPRGDIPPVTRSGHPAPPPDPGLGPARLRRVTHLRERGPGSGAAGPRCGRPGGRAGGGGGRRRRRVRAPGARRSALSRHFPPTDPLHRTEGPGWQRGRRAGAPGRGRGPGRGRPGRRERSGAERGLAAAAGPRDGDRQDGQRQRRSAEEARPLRCPGAGPRWAGPGRAAAPGGSLFVWEMLRMLRDLLFKGLNEAAWPPLAV
ncbi:uncharacterized protein [Taeniopygia guttata]|uniref:uncharacterized protein n=1 Tax=Taeniopygia guttata TaxID=59729 RepID=UPI003BB85702